MLAFNLGYGAALSMLEDQMSALFIGAAAGMLWQLHQMARAGLWSDPYGGARMRLRPSVLAWLRRRLWSGDEGAMTNRLDETQNNFTLLRLLLALMVVVGHFKLLSGTALPARSRSTWPMPRSTASSWSAGS